MYFSAEGENILVDTNTEFNMNAHINAPIGGEIKIGKYCLFGPNVVLRTAGHNYDNTDVYIREQGHNSLDIHKTSVQSNGSVVLPVETQEKQSSRIVTKGYFIMARPLIFRTHQQNLDVFHE